MARIENLGVRECKTRVQTHSRGVGSMRRVGDVSGANVVLASTNVLLFSVLLWQYGVQKGWWKRLQWALESIAACSTSPVRSTPVQHFDDLHPLLDKDYEPPLPKPVADALQRSCLCFLATTQSDQPHLSLMRFTYAAGLGEDKESEVMIISTRRNTKKCVAPVQRSPVVPWASHPALKAIGCAMALVLCCPAVDAAWALFAAGLT
jgi:hypothetical protein